MILYKNKKVIFNFIEKNREQLNIRVLCKVLNVSTSGNYAWRSRPESAHRQYDIKLMAIIKEIHQGYHRTYGAARVHQALRQKGYSCSRNRKSITTLG